MWKEGLEEGMWKKRERGRGGSGGLGVGEGGGSAIYDCSDGEGLSVWKVGGGGRGWMYGSLKL